MKEFNLKKIYGNVIIIGNFDDDFTTSIKENKEVKNCDILTLQKGSTNGLGKSKIINIKKLKQKYHKKRINFIICNIDDVKKYKKTFIKNSIYINKDKIYFQGKMKDLKEFLDLYKRYNCKGNLKDNILTINTNVKVSLIKNIYYYLYDTIQFIVDLIGDILST